ncbi:unnamed protein product [Phyllotreta striolata]|uniref:Nitrogen permease regulator 2-like protein n=1 Tax=Phyllotreta striolata TaxID=444603 RepID=A0A9N9TTL5_PHYSR|nr:unnamed protein product [Phyllotreta striolata]
MNLKSKCDNTRKEGPIRCIFFCEFHHTAGPMISCQVPENYISKELFDSISVYIITKAELQRSVITVTLHDYKILGFPVKIDDRDKYVRNAFHFNLCFVCDSNARTVQYETVVMKFSNYLIAREGECSFLSDGKVNEKLSPILTQVMDELNNKGECALIEGATTTHLKVCTIRLDPTPVMDHQVPIFIRELPEQQWDLTTQQVTPFIDGFNHVSKIAVLSDVENNLVKACVQNLVYYGVVALIPLFQYGNVYCTTPKLKMMMQDNDMQKKCLNYVAKNPRHLPVIRDVFRIYSAMTRGTTIRDLCIRFNPSNLRINERKLVQFGVLEGIIRRVQKYPVILSDNADLHKSLSGVSSLDELCCSIGVPSQQLEDQLERDNNVMLLWK